MKYYVIAGEASGDLHASNLMKAIKKLDPDAEFRFWGGDLMAEAGGTLVKHYRETAYMGIWDVVKNFHNIKKNFKLCEKDMLAYKPDVFIPVDYGGFNLRMAKFAHENGIRVHYYIPPKVWASTTKRVKKLRAYVEHSYVILPFEEDFLKKHGVTATYTGSPVVDAVYNRQNKNEPFGEFIKRNNLDNRPKIALLAGSRRSEIKYNLPAMLKMVPKFPDFQFVIAGAPSFTKDDYNQYIEGKDVALIFEQTYELLQQSRAAIVTSGTATLETALLNCPQVVTYKMWGGRFSHLIAKALIKVKHISLVNLILEKEAVKELFQCNFSFELLESELGALTAETPRRNEMLNDYKKLKELMGEPGASSRTAELILKHLKKIEN
ncbi:MAG: lipid-A-disaccharide synthase [Chlorobi bacterium]|nr:lipid-A-disaccharide synthase [Chlorobiota bacterium]